MWIFVCVVLDYKISADCAADRRLGPCAGQAGHMHSGGAYESHALLLIL